MNVNVDVVESFPNFGDTYKPLRLNIKYGFKVLEAKYLEMQVNIFYKKMEPKNVISTINSK